MVLHPHLEQWLIFPEEAGLPKFIQELKQPWENLKSELKWNSIQIASEICQKTLLVKCAFLLIWSGFWTDKRELIQSVQIYNMHLLCHINIKNTHCTDRWQLNLSCQIAKQIWLNESVIISPLIWVFKNQSMSQGLKAMTDFYFRWWDRDCWCGWCW